MNKFLVAVTKPCTENWNEMTAAEQGRNCMRCNKIVIDFTGLSDKEIIRHIQNKKNDNICGRFKESQLNRWLFESELARTNPAMYKYLAGLLLMLASQQISAQSGKPQANPIEIPATPAGEKLHMADPPVNVTVSTTNSNVFTSSTIRIGGARSISGKNDPLLVLNGKIVKLSKLSDIAPEDIETESLLKGSAATALYGSKGINGAIIITTKKAGKKFVPETPEEKVICNTDEGIFL